MRNKQLKIAEPVQNECEVSLAMTAVLWPKALAKGASVKELSLRARLPLRGLYTEETGDDMIRPLCSGSYGRCPIGVLCPLASMVLEFVAVSLAKPGSNHGYPV